MSLENPCKTRGSKPQSWKCKCTASV